MGQLVERGPAGLIVARGGREGTLTRARIVDTGTSTTRPALANVPEEAGVLAIWLRRGQLLRAFVPDAGEPETLWPDRHHWDRLGPIAADWMREEGAVVLAAESDGETGLVFVPVAGDGRSLAPPVRLATLAAVPGELDVVWTGHELAVPFAESSGSREQISLALVTPCASDDR
jgi:hypothetical protein